VLLLLLQGGRVELPKSKLHVLPPLLQALLLAPLLLLQFLRALLATQVNRP
jgi:hypothetical protein